MFSSGAFAAEILKGNKQSVDFICPDTLTFIFNTDDNLCIAFMGAHLNRSTRSGKLAGIADQVVENLLD